MHADMAKYLSQHVGSISANPFALTWPRPRSNPKIARTMKV